MQPVFGDVLLARDLAKAAEEALGAPAEGGAAVGGEEEAEEAGAAAKEKEEAEKEKAEKEKKKKDAPKPWDEAQEPVPLRVESAGAVQRAVPLGLRHRQPALPARLLQRLLALQLGLDRLDLLRHLRDRVRRLRELRARRRE